MLTQQVEWGVCVYIRLYGSRDVIIAREQPPLVSNVVDLLSLVSVQVPFPGGGGSRGNTTDPL